MDKETAQHVFEPFFTTKDVGRGTGLGLSTVYGIVKENNGFITLYSEPGIGTTFHIYLPFHAGKAVSKKAKADSELPLSQGETVLVIEDDPLLMEMGTMMLEFLGYNVLSAMTPGEALQLAEEHSEEIHLFLTDVVMPEMNGSEVIERLLDIRPGVAYIFMSGYAADVVVDQGVLKKGVNFFQKPFLLKELAVKIREALESNDP